MTPDDFKVFDDFEQKYYNPKIPVMGPDYQPGDIKYKDICIPKVFRMEEYPLNTIGSYWAVLFRDIPIILKLISVTGILIFHFQFRVSEKQMVI